jgi:cysteine desulfurase
MGVLTHGNVRVSLARDTTEADVDRLLRVLPGAVAQVREQIGARGL